MIGVAEINHRRWNNSAAPIQDAIAQGSLAQLRPAPLMVRATGIGSDKQHPFLSTLLLTLLALPSLYALTNQEPRS